MANARKVDTVPGTSWTRRDIAQMLREANALSESLRQHRRFIVENMPFKACHGDKTRRMLARSERLIKIRGPL